jgi:hypothetical protein
MTNLANTEDFNLREVNEPSYGQEVKPKSRAEIRREWSENLTDSSGAVEVFGGLIDVLGMTDISEVRPLSDSEVEVLTEELVQVRAAKDVVEGRESALKGFATKVIDLKLQMSGVDPATNSGYLTSQEHGIKLSKEVSGGKLSVDIDLLRENLDPDQFESITNEVMISKTIVYPGGKKVVEEDLYYELNEEALEKELKVGNIGMEQIIKSTTPGKTRTAFYVRTQK